MNHPASLSLDRLLADCTIERTRRGGPGGQHRNKVETAVVITHQPTGVQAEASERRSQAENLTQAIHRLRICLARAVRTTPGESTSPLWAARVSGGRVAVNPEHDDAPVLLAEALDALAVCDWTPAIAGNFLRVSPSQLVKFLKQHDALPLLNENRRTLGLPPLR